MKRLFTILALIALSAFLTYAQESTGELIGKVTLAEDGSPLPGVTISLTGTFGKASFVSTKEGNFRFSKLSVGAYDLRFELQGFKTVEKTGIRVGLGQSVPVYVSMEPGTLQEEVTVVAQTQMIDTRKAAISANYTSEMIASLPIAMRTSEIINLAPGVMSAHPQIAGQGSATLHGFGVQNYRGEYYLDGGSFRSTYGHGNMPTGVSTDRVEEVQVTTSGQDIANVQGGPTINFVSKRGGNRLAGDAYISLLDKSLQANNKGFPAYMSTPTTQVYKDTPEFGKVYGLGYTENSGIFRTYDYGISLGGPIVTDHLWFFGAWSVIDSWNKNYYGAPADRYYTPDMYGKLNYQYKTFTAEGSYTHRDSAAINVPWFSNSPNNLDRKNPADVYTAQAAITLWQKLLVSGKFTYFNAPTDTGQANNVWTGAGNTTYEAGRTYNPPNRYYTYNFFKNPPYNTEPTGYWQHYGQQQKRPYFVIEGDYFAEKFLGGDHEIKFGFDRNYARYVEEYMAPNSSFARDYPATATQLAPTYANGLSYWGWFQTYSDPHGEKRSTRTGIYLQDTMTYGRLAINAGLRVDWHAWTWEDALIHAIAPADEEFGGGQLNQWVGEISVKAGKQDIGSTFSPRVAVTWDLFGTGKDLIKLQYANYGGAVDNLAFRPGFKSGYTRGEFVYPTIDYNMNYIPNWPTAKFPTAKNEFFLNDILGRWPTPDDIDMMRAKGIAEQAAWNAAHPGVPVPWDYYTYPGWFYLSFSGAREGSKGTGTKPLDELDSSFSPDRVMEITVGYEKQLSTDISVQVLGAYKKEYNFAWWRGYKGTLDNYTLMPVDTMKSLGKDPTTGWEVFVADPSYGTANGYRGYTYGSDYYNKFTGLEFIFNKRFSHGWMLQASVDLEDWKVHYADLAVDNPDGKAARSTLRDYYQDSFLGAGEYFSTEPRQNSRWHFKIAGLVRLPFALNFSGFIDAREGYLTDRWLASNSGQYLPKFGTKYGDNRLPNFWYANFTLDRTFAFSEQVAAKIFLTAYNAFNNIQPVAINSTVVPTRWPPQDYPTDVNRARIVQVGVRFSFR
jgi:Carboxypeptidase regulatory-like domain